MSINLLNVSAKTLSFPEIIMKFILKLSISVDFVDCVIESHFSQEFLEG